MRFDVTLVFVCIMGLMSGITLWSATRAIAIKAFRSRIGDSISLFLGLFVPVFGIMLYYRDLLTWRDLVTALAFALLACAFFVVRLLIAEHRHLLDDIDKRDSA
jgi:hypothetical protein